MAVPGFEDLDFESFHREQLPERLRAGNGELAARAPGTRGSLAFRMPTGPAFTYVARGSSIEVIAGDATADTVIELDPESWQGLVHDYETAPGLLYGGRAKSLRGKAMRLVAWEPALRAMYTGRPAYDSGCLELLDRQGEPLDPEQTFDASDRPGDCQDMAHFLHTAGYLFVRNVFAGDEISAFLAEAAELGAEAVRGDKLSWWVKDKDGHEILCRVTRAAAKPRLATIPNDPRVLELVALSNCELTHRVRRSAEEGVTIIWKRPAISEGLSNLPWHRDCGMGGHSVMCPVLVVSVFLTAATPETGELVTLPGSWRTTHPYIDANDSKAPRGAHFRARPGDVSLHYGDVMHAAPPPTRLDLAPGAYRISAVTGFAPPGARNHRGASSYNDVLHQRDDGQIEHLSKVADRAEGSG